MPSVIRNEFATTAASAFLDKFGQAATGNDNLFMVIGQANPWTNAPWSTANDLTPPTPSGSLDDKAEHEKYSIAAKRIPKSNVQMVIPKVIWVTGTEYNLLDPSASDPYAPTDWYVVNSLDEVFVAVVDPGPGNPSNIEPTKSLADAFGGGDEFTAVLADGYQWEYMYTVSGTASKTSTTDWLPVNYGPTVNIAGGENPDSFRRLGVDNIMIVGELDATLTYVGDDYRQISIYKNMKEIDGVTLAATDLYEIVDATWQGAPSEDDLSALVGMSSSDMLYLENRSPILRSPTQVEELKIVLSLG